MIERILEKKYRLKIFEDIHNLQISNVVKIKFSSTEHFLEKSIITLMLDLYTYKEQPRQDNEQERIRFFFVTLTSTRKFPRFRKLGKWP